MQQYSRGELSIHFKRSGKGKPLILLHGFLENHQMWDTLIPILHSWNFETILVDLPCHGKSRYDGEKCSMAQMADIMHQFCHDQNIIDPWIIGHSMGGYVGLEMLKLGAYRVCLLHSNFWEDSEQKKSDRDRVIRLVHKSKNLFVREAIPHLFYPPNKHKCQEAIELLVEGAVLIPAEEIAASTAGLRDREANHDLFEHHDIKIIHGEQDPVCPSEVLEAELAELKGEAEVFRIENCGHMSIWEQPEKLIQSLKTILV